MAEETEMAATIEEPELVKRAIPMRRFGTPEEVAACEASYTGQYLKKVL